LHPTFNRLLKSEKIVDAKDVERAQKLSNDPVEFFRQVVGFEPTEYQVSLIRIAMLLLWRAHYPYNRRIAEAHGRFSKEDYSDWLQNVEIYLARAIRRLAQLDQPKVYLFWKK
jgi:hypothetical protein